MNSQAKEILSILKVCGYRDSELTANLLNVVDKEASTEYLNDLDEFFTNVSKHEGIDHELRVIPQGELLPCPFCGGNDCLWSDDGYPEVKCLTGSKSSEEVTAKWNKRARL